MIDAEATLPPVPLPLTPVATETLVALGFHEAGHAVVALVLGLPVAYAMLQPKSGRWGHDACMMPAVSMDHVGWEDRAVIWLAGPAAEMEHFLWLRDPFVPRGDGSDVLKVTTLLIEQHDGAALESPAVSRSLMRLTTRTFGLVRQHWAWIGRVATNLAQWRRLSGEEIERLRYVSDEGTS